MDVINTHCLSKDSMSHSGVLYDGRVPKLWTETIEEHRRAVHDATLDAAAELIAQHGLLSVTMSQIASATGIGRATLYKYFPDVAAILTAWHERQVANHLDRLARVRDHLRDPGARLEAVLRAYAASSHHANDELSAFLHRSPHVDAAEQHLRRFIEQLIADAAAAGVVRNDTPPAELADYCLYALGAGRDAGSKAATDRLIALILDGLRPV